MNTGKSRRIESIDLMRGVVMVLMALDHARDKFGTGGWYLSDPAAITPFLFLTRWSTHCCAPVFVFLAGTGAFLYGARGRTTGELSHYLWTRGLWLIVLEMTVISFSWWLDITHSIFLFGVIWAIGMSMVCLALFVYLPRKLILALGVVMVFGHNLLDGVTLEGLSPVHFLWWMLYRQTDFPLASGQIVISIEYPLLPWIGVMALGYCFGEWYKSGFDGALRRKYLLRLGVGSILFFVLLRAFNLYGDPGRFGHQSGVASSVVSFLNTTKYPVSLQFLLMTMGPAFLFLRWSEAFSGKVANFFVVFGRVPLLFYVLHFYLLKVLETAVMVLSGRPWTDTIKTAAIWNAGKLPDINLGLAVVYTVWILVIAALYPLCRKYMEYKARNKSAWWLSYL